MGKKLRLKYIHSDLYRFCVGHPNRWGYWSNSRFAHWIKKTAGLTNPVALTATGWRDWQKDAEARRPVVFWITDSLLDVLQDIAYFPRDVYKNISRWVRNGFIDKTHRVLNGVPFGSYNDPSSIVLPTLMNILVDFIEKEKAHMHRISATKEEKDRIAKLSNREAALEYLDWEIGLTHGDRDYTPPDHPLYNKPTRQAEDAAVQKEIYLWWKDVYPNRPDPYSETGWSEYCRTHDLTALDCEDPEENAKTKKILDSVHIMEAAYDKEDEEMMIKLIKIRESLWT